jgi:hypothetical protein
VEVRTKSRAPRPGPSDPNMPDYQVSTLTNEDEANFTAGILEGTQIKNTSQSYIDRATSFKKQDLDHPKIEIQN